ncbi:hypothetical protein BDP27DRAFT_1422617 [Rhodocollybia butyracea]|uniref:Uncharacterized protein n=1 Tax=Rhodocollybia butyracea TaxID=206335 RepID=A0A9P5PTM4_9AGAR|nr:hypothetical protein BDP27DRAFT_1422617 [Rhodocollybia butyracea]
MTRRCARLFNTLQNRGYVLPEPAVFVNHQNEVSRAQYFLTYLKVRRAFIAAINLLGPIVCQRLAKDWHRLLSLELHGLLQTNTHEGTARLRLCNEINEVAARMGSSFSINLTDLSLASTSWKGHIYTGRLPDDVQTEVLQEIFEISFKQELMLLDQFLYRLVPRSQGREDGEFENEYDTSTREDQNLVIEDAFFSTGPPAFGHLDGRLRQATLHAFFQIMRGWTRSNTVRMNSTTVRAGERVGSMSVRGTGELKETDFYLAAYYIHAFADFFKRASTMPHFL